MPAIVKMVFFDMGGTLEVLHYDDAMRLEACADLARILRERGIAHEMSGADLYAHFRSGWRSYQAYRGETNRELPPERIWADYFLADAPLPTGAIESMADELSDFFEVRFAERALREEAPEVLSVLDQRGTRMGVISNTISRTMMPRLLERYGLIKYFDPIVLSTVYGRRKPDPSIFLYAAELAGFAPHECAYVGDTISRDVVGARRANFGMVVQIPSFISARVDSPEAGAQPDARISDLRELLGLLEEGGVG